MAKGSVRKKGKKWYYRFYVEDESGRQVQREFAGTESKSETEALLRKAMEDYEAKKFVAKSENATVPIPSLITMPIASGEVAMLSPTIGEQVGQMKIETYTSLSIMEKIM